MTGLVVCAFFVMGVMTGFSPAGRAITLRTVQPLSHYGDLAAEELAPARERAAHYAAAAAGWADRAGLHRIAAEISTFAPQPRIVVRATPAPHAPAAPPPAVAPAPAPNRDDAIALVERKDGFYALDSSGGLRGPVSPGLENDLPILSGAALEETRGGAMTGYTAILVRAETQLSELVSEMRIADDGTAELFLARARTELTIDLDPDRASAELQRAAQVLGNWSGRENLIAALDMTVPGEAIARLHGADAAARTSGVEKVSRRTSKTGLTRLAEESAAP